MNTQQLILTTEQLAQAFGVTAKIITNNFQRHAEDFTEGVHYFVAEGDKLKDFEDLSERSSNNDHLSERSSKRGGARRKYLWTQAGAFAHVWILKSAGAKAAYEKLIEQAEKPRSGIPEEKYLALEKRYEKIAQIAFKETEVPHFKPDTILNETKLGDIESVLRQARDAVKQVRAAHKNDKTLWQALENLERQITRLEARVEHTQEKLDETHPRFMEQADLKEIIFSPDLQRLTSPTSTLLMIENK